MKLSGIITLCLVTSYCFSQQVRTALATLGGSNKIDVIKSSIDVPSWHEKSFWPLYNRYMDKLEGVSNTSYRALADVAKIDEEVSDQDAYQYVRNLLDNRYKAFDVRKQYFMEIGNEFNGIIALQFIQTEALLDMIQSEEPYEATFWHQYRFHPKALTEDKFKQAKHNTIAKALSLTQKDSAFWNVYHRYEEECNALLGEEYSLFSFFAGEATDYTPALAKRLGYDLLQLMEREIKLKDQYFEEMNNTVGASLAARFFAWEDYYSLVSKMHAWADQ